MKIHLLRHGTRNYGIGDIPLNDEGHEEALALASVPALLGVKKIFSSPKKRAQMTVEPLAQSLGLSIEIMNVLDQRQNVESLLEFRQRVQKAINQLEEMAKGHGNILACSHSDWLAESIELIPSNIANPDTIMFQCAEFLTFEVKDGLWRRI